MNDKSHVGMLHVICQICCKQDESQTTILLDRRLKNSLDKDNYQPGYCTDCQANIDKGLIALVECDESKTIIKDSVVKPEDAHRTGRFFWLSQDLMKDMFTGLPKKVKSMAFIDVEVGDQLFKLGEEVAERLKNE